MHPPQRVIWRLTAYHFTARVKYQHSVSFQTPYNFARSYFKNSRIDFFELSAKQNAPRQAGPWKPLMNFPFLIWADAKYADKVPNEATAAPRERAMEPTPV